VRRHKDLIVVLSIVTVIYLATLYLFTNKLSPPKNRAEVESITKIEIPILLYHYVEYNQDKRDFKRDDLNIEPHIFEAQINTLMEAGYTFITPRDIPELFENISSCKEKYVILSFDDGYEDFYTDVFPILIKYDVKAVNYVVYNFIGKQNHMKKHQIEEVIRSNLVEIGSHTINHAGLTFLEAEELYIEIFLSKVKLEKDFGIEVFSFSYPNGYYNNIVINSVRKAGYSTAVTSDDGAVVFKDRLYEIPRLRPGYNIGQDLLNIIIPSKEKWVL